jgi:hypothetical protein
MKTMGKRKIADVSERRECICWSAPARESVRYPQILPGGNSNQQRCNRGCPLFREPIHLKRYLEWTPDSCPVLMAERLGGRKAGHGFWRGEDEVEWQLTLRCPHPTTLPENHMFLTIDYGPTPHTLETHQTINYTTDGLYAATPSADIGVKGDDLSALWIGDANIQSWFPVVEVYALILGYANWKPNTDYPHFRWVLQRFLPLTLLTHGTTCINLTRSMEHHGGRNVVRGPVYSNAIAVEIIENTAANRPSDREGDDGISRSADDNHSTRNAASRPTSSTSPSASTTSSISLSTSK